MNNKEKVKWLVSDLATIMVKIMSSNGVSKYVASFTGKDKSLLFTMTLETIIDDSERKDDENAP